MIERPARSSRGGRSRIAFTVLFALTALLPTDGWSLGRYEQRATYKKALDHLTAGRMSDFTALRKRLDGYPLQPYLDYYELQSQISSVPPDAVMRFRERHAELPVADIVYARWLKGQGSQKRWDAFLEYYEPSSDVELRCYHLRALFGTGSRDAALDQVGELWLSPQSQPKACDPLFELWIDQDRLTESMVWERLSLALEASNRTLARYLQRFFVTPNVKSSAQSFYSVHVSPGTITQTSRFATDDRYSRAVIGHGLKRLAAQDPEAAEAAWLQYQDSHRFPAEDIATIEAALAIGLARSGRFPDHRTAADTLPAQGLSEAALARQSWADLSFWIERLPVAERESRRWQYWLARSIDETTLDSKRSQLAFAALAADRDYYGFLAAERIGQPVRFNHQPSAASHIEITRFSNLPAVQRATELYAVGDLVNARREWYRLLPTLSVREKATAARLADGIGWISQGIRTANDAPDLRDDLDLRFPAPYTDEFQRVSHITTVPETFLLAIARQESLFDPSARSSANARGLMQLIQPTAERVARRVGLPEPTAAELYYPALNIELGGHHLADLMTRYGARRPLVAAAYNAGEHRVDRWIKDASGQPMDVWIETIPFSETRNYVKNVMAFAKVYGYRRDSPRPMFEAHETRLP